MVYLAIMSAIMSTMTSSEWFILKIQIISCSHCVFPNKDPDQKRQVKISCLTSIDHEQVSFEWFYVIELWHLFRRSNFIFIWFVAINVEQICYLI